MSFLIAYRFQYCKIRVVFGLVGVLIALVCLPSAALAQVPPTPIPATPAPPAKPPPQHVKPAGPVSSISDSQLADPDIIGGEIAADGAWPWQAALLSPGEPNAYFAQYCGGSLVAPSWVLTAAHCVEGLPNGVGMVEVLLGRNKLSGTGGQRLSVDLIVVHPDYSALSLDADLALLRLASPADEQPLALDAPDDAALADAMTLATVTGWGRFIAGLPLASDELRQVELPLVSRAICASETVWGDLITDNMICAGYGSGDKSACYGDSGGPLMVPIGEEPGWAQVGIVSWGPADCNDAQRYNVYTRVSVFRDWIESCVDDPISLACRGAGFVGDDYEPDGDLVLSRELLVGAEGERHNFHRPQDNDWFFFQAVANEHYVIATYDLERRSDTVLWLIDQDGLSVLRYNDDAGNATRNTGNMPYDLVASVIVWTAPVDGTYYILAHAFGTQSFGAQTGYTIRVVAMENDRYLPLLRYLAE